MRINSVQMSNAFVIIKMCYVLNQWYDISCATLYDSVFNTDTFQIETGRVTALLNFLGNCRLTAEQDGGWFGQTTDL